MSEITRLKTKRAYDESSPQDGCRILVDRMWPRGVSKDQLKIDQWAKDIAPGGDLRKWFAHDRDKWDKFKDRYFSELDGKKQRLEEILGTCNKKTITFVYAAKDQECNNAAALMEYVKNRVL